MRTVSTRRAPADRDRSPGLRSVGRGRGTRREVEDAIRALSCVQLDSITAVERSHRITLGSRVGAYPRETVSRLLGAGPHLRVLGARGVSHPGRGVAALPAPDDESSPVAWRRASREHPELAEEVLAAIGERGPLTSRDFEGKGGGGMWNWKPAKLVLEALWNSGEIVIAGRVSGFQRSTTSPERVLPREVLDAPVPDEATRDRELTLRAVRARGALTEAGIVEHWRFNGGAARIRPHADALVARRGSRAAPRRGRRGRRARPRRDRPRPAAPDRGRPPLPVRQPPLGPAVRAPGPRLRPPDRGVQARPRAPVRLLRAARSSGAIGSSGAPTSSPSAPRGRSS